MNSKINVLFHIRYDKDIVSNEKLFSKNDIFVLYNQDSSKQNKNLIIRNGKEMTHATINEEIENNNNSNYKKSFNENLETYFGIAKNEKSDWDPSAFFGQDENKEKLEKFIQEFEIEDFLKSKMD